MTSRLHSIMRGGHSGHRSGGRPSARDGWCFRGVGTASDFVAGDGRREKGDSRGRCRAHCSVTCALRSDEDDRSTGEGSHDVEVGDFPHPGSGTEHHLCYCIYKGEGSLSLVEDLRGLYRFTNGPGIDKREGRNKPTGRGKSQMAIN
jgi:hypothetical protein